MNHTNSINGRTLWRKPERRLFEAGKSLLFFRESNNACSEKEEHTMFILDYNGNKREVNEVDLNDETIFNAWIKVLSGDEILYVIRKDGTREEYDSSNDRMWDFNDGEYDIVINGKLVMEPKEFDKFEHRTSSYWYWD